MLRTRRTSGSAGVAVGGVVFTLLSGAPAHATPVLTLDNGRGDSAWKQNVWYDRNPDRNFYDGRYLERDSYNQFGLSWSGQLGAQYFGDGRWSHDNKGKKKDPDEVPEPGTLGLFLSALLGAGLFQRARKRQGR